MVSRDTSLNQERRWSGGVKILFVPCQQQARPLGWDRGGISSPKGGEVAGRGKDLHR